MNNREAADKERAEELVRQHLNNASFFKYDAAEIGRGKGGKNNE